MDLSLAGLKLVPMVSTEVGELACKNCYFAKKGRSTRTCPTVKFVDPNRDTTHFSNLLLCATISGGFSTYFIKEK